MTHYGSGADVLAKILNEAPRICYHGYSGIIYNHPTKLDKLKEKWMELSFVYNSVPLHYIDRINENHHFCCKELYNKNFIYFIKKPTLCMEHMLSVYKNEKMALEYYAFRLRRICEMIIKTPNFCLIKYEDIINVNKRKNCFNKIEKLLSLKEDSLPNSFIPDLDEKNGMQYGKIVQYADNNDYLPSKEVIKRGNDIYEKYNKFLERFIQI